MMKKVLVLILAALALLGCVACGDTKTPAKDTEPAATDRPAVITEGPVTDLVLTGENAYRLVIPAKNTYAESDWAAAIAYYVPGLETVKETELRDADKAAGHLILVGTCDLPESKKAAELLEFGRDYVILAENDVIVLYSAHEENLGNAAYDLIEAVKDENGVRSVSLPQKKYVRYDYPAKNLLLAGKSIADYALVVPENSADDRAIADAINVWMYDNAGKELPIRTANEPETDCEILIGNTGRAADTFTGNISAQNGHHVELVGTKAILAYAGIGRGIDQLFVNQLNAKTVDAISADGEADPYAIFRTDNFAAVYATKSGQHISAETLDAATPGVLALLSDCMYFESELQKGLARGELWVYSNSSTYVPQSGTFDNMVKSGKTGTNCAMPQAWALIDLGVITNGKHMYGKTDGSLANKDTAGVGPKAAAACDLISWRGIPDFRVLFAKGLVEPGDIFFAKGHTFIYMGDELFMAAGHDGKWHTNANAKTEDGQKACFETWVCDMKSNTDYNYSIYWQMRFKEDYVPEYYRNAAGQLVKCPMWDESHALTETPFVAIDGSLS